MSGRVRRLLAVLAWRRACASKAVTVPGSRRPRRDKVMTRARTTGAGSRFTSRDPKNESKPGAKPASRSSHRDWFH
jgi:hypothetical protein